MNMPTVYYCIEKQHQSAPSVTPFFCTDYKQIQRKKYKFDVTTQGITSDKDDLSSMNQLPLESNSGAAGKISYQ